MSLVTVNEGTTFILELSFEDEDGNAVTPSSASYRIDDVLSGTAIKAETAFTPSSSVHELVITATENGILDNTYSREKKLVTVNYVYGSSSYEANAEYEYYVKNLGKVS
jgi:hypothetical protein